MAEKFTQSNPFPGLRSYEYEDHRLFFGREAHIQAVRTKLLDGRFLALIGSSGSGKSSLIKAGLIPSLEEQPGGKDWKVIVFRPGGNPVRHFAAALWSVVKTAHPDLESVDVAQLEAAFSSNPASAFEMLGTISDSKILLVIDQFEELFRYELAEGSMGKQRTEAFVHLLLALVRQRDVPVHAVITMRSDYLDHCTEFNGLTEVINKGYYLLPKMNPEEIRQVIAGPVEAFGATIEPALVTNLLDELAINPDFLPILQHALMRTWDRWKSTKPFNAPISRTEYEAIGTMEQSITQHAEEIYTQRLDEKRRNAAVKLFKSLVVLGPSDTSSLHPTVLREIIQITGIPDYLLIDVVQVFRENGVSFLTPKPGVKIDHDAIIDVSVEKVLTFWERCRKWIEEELESAKLYRQLSYSALLYQEGRTGLWVNPELQMGLKWLKESEPTLEWAQRYDPYFERAINFLDYSKKQYELEVRQKEERQKRELRKARIFASVLGISSLVSLLFLIIALVLRTQAQQSEEVALEKEALALAEGKRAQEQSREAISQKKIAEQQGTFAELQRNLTEEQKAIAVREQEKAVRESEAAKAARSVAEEQRAQADNARREAQQLQKEAERQKENALVAQRESERQKVLAQRSQKEAETSRNDALRQRSKAVARFIAIQSFQMPQGEELAALLALKAYEFNVKNGGERENPDIFNALSRAAGAKATLQAHNDIVRIVAEQRGTPLFASAGDDGAINIWNYLVPSTRPIAFRNPRQTFKSIRSLAFTADGKALFTGSSNGQIVRWDSFSAGALPTRTLTAHEGVVLFMGVYGAGSQSRLVSAGSSGQVRWWDIADRRLEVIKNIHTGKEISCVEAIPGTPFLLLGTISGAVFRINTDEPDAAPAEFQLGNLRGKLISLAATPNGKHLYFGTSDGMLYDEALVNNEPVRTTLKGRQATHTSGITRIAFSPDGSRMATACYDWKIRLWSTGEDLSKQQPVVLSDFDYWVMDVRFTRDGNKLLAAGADKTVRIWDINSADLYAEVSKKISRELTEEEWDQYIGKDIPYEKLSRTIR